MPATPISWRPSERDIENLALLRKALPWVTGDADVIRYALEFAARKKEPKRPKG